MRAAALLPALALPVALQAQDPIGVVLTVKGQVTARGVDGSVRPLSRRAQLHARDTLITGADGYVQLTLADKAQIALSADTEFMFDRYAFDDDPATRDAAVMTLARGCFIMMSGSVGASPGDEHRIDTPVATIHIRGTVHAAAFNGNELHTANYEGGTTVTNAQGSIDLGLGASYDFSRTLAGTAPEGLVSLPAPQSGCGLQPNAATANATLPLQQQSFTDRVLNSSAVP